MRQKLQDHITGQDVKGKKFRETTLHLKYNKTNVIASLKEQKDKSNIVQNNIQKTKTGRVIFKPIKYQ